MKPRVLYVTHRVPWPPDRGDRIRTWNILKFLSRRANVDLLCLADERVTDDTVAALQQVTARHAVVPHAGRRRWLQGLTSLLSGGSVTEGLFRSQAAMSILREWSLHTVWDATLVSSSGVSAYTAPDVVGKTARRWIDLIDVDSQKWADYSAATRGPASLFYGLESRRLRTTERQLARTCERLLVVSEAECRLFQEFCPTDRIMAVGNGVDTSWFCPGPPPAADALNCVFVGVMNYRPNVDAVSWFSQEVWPSVRQVHPTARFRIVGRSPSAAVRALEKLPGIDVTGAVADVRPWLYQAHCAVVPLRIARGVQNKVLEAMACGRPVICSSPPLQGLHAEPGLHLLRADTPEEWLAALDSVLTDRNRQQELGIAASEWVRQQHCWDSCLEPLCDLLGPVAPDVVPAEQVTA